MFTGGNGLNQEYVTSPDVLSKTYKDVLVAEGEHFALTKGDFQVGADRLGQIRVAVACEHLHILVHIYLPSLAEEQSTDLNYSIGGHCFDALSGLRGKDAD